jgi:hypothetical protein
LPVGAVQLRVYVTLPAPAGVTDCVPLVASVPVHPPLAVQLLALVVDQVKVALWPSVMVVGATENVTVGANGGPMFPPPL